MPSIPVLIEMHGDGGLTVKSPADPEMVFAVVNAAWITLLAQKIGRDVKAGATTPTIVSPNQDVLDAFRRQQNHGGGL